MASNLLNFLRDSQAQSEMRNALTDAANRGMVAGSLGAPVDMATTLTNLLIAGGGYVGHKAGLLSQPPELIDSRNVPGSSEWIGQKMQNAGAVSPNRNALAEFGMGLLSPVAYKGAQKMGGLLYNAESNALANAAKPSNMVMQGQRGAIAWHGPETKNNMNADYLDNLISSQRYIDRDVVAKKIKSGSFNVSVTPEFEVDGRTVRAITDGHHALEAAIRSGNRPNFIEMTPSTDDRIGLLNRGNIDDYLNAAYHDSPWYWYATKGDIW